MKDIKRKLILGLGILVVLLAAAGLFTLFQQPDPLQMTTLALENLNQADSFAFSVAQQQTVAGNERQLTRISGYKSGENIHIQGQMAGSQVEMIKIGQTLYSKDPFSGRWIRYDDISIAQRVFLVELDPLATLQIKEIGEVVPKGESIVDETKCRVYTFKPSIQNQLLESFWSDFEYTLYITKRTKMILKAEITALNKETMEPMKITLEFKDFNKKITIQPPQAAG